ncbi:MAG: ABC transporter ATP-binding protein [Candidatus Heimdallarchaeaceae archaeon]
MMPQDIVFVENISRIYQIGETEIHAVKDVTLKLKEGEFTAIVGPSGSGKTTLLNVIGTLEKPTKGTVYVGGVNTGKLSVEEIAKFRRRNIGFVFQFFNLVDALTVYENIELPLVFDGVPHEKRKKKIEEIIEEFGLKHLVSKFPEELSSGERQRVAIMRALINEPKIVLADEPTGNLDSKTGIAILGLFEELNREKGITILMVTHDLSAAKRTKRILHMRDGKITVDQKKEKLPVV